MKIKNDLLYLCILMTAEPTSARKLFEKICLKLLEDLLDFNPNERLHVSVYSSYWSIIQNEVKLRRAPSFTTLLGHSWEGSQRDVMSLVQLIDLYQDLSVEQRFLAYLIDLRGVSQRDAAKVLRVSEEDLRIEVFSTRRRLFRAFRGKDKVNKTA